MKRFLATALLLSSFFSQNLQKDSYKYFLSNEAKTLLQQNWILEDFIVDPGKATPQSLLLFSHAETKEKIFLCTNRILARGFFDSWEITYIPSSNDFLLLLKENTEYRLVSLKKDFGTGNRILIEKKTQKGVPAFLIESEGTFTLYTDKEKRATIAAEEACFLPATWHSPNILFLLFNGQYQLYSQGKFSKPFKELLAWSLIEGEKSKKSLSLLVESRMGEYLCITDQKSSSIYKRPTETVATSYTKEELFQPSSKKIDLLAKNEQPVTLYDSQKKEWVFYFKGKLFDGWEEEPSAFSKLPPNSGELAWAGKKQGQWFWFKDNITIAETDFFSFEPSDIQFAGDSFALIRKNEASYEIYANFETRDSFFTKPSLHLIDRQLLEANDRDSHFFLYQLAYNKTLKQGKPFDYRLFQEDFFDFWLHQGGVFKAYKEGEIRGEIKTSQTSDLMVFLINHSLFFPKWTTDSKGETEIYLSGGGGTIGPFQSITPLEHPDQKRSRSTLFSSLIADTKEGQIALYTDAIIGPADAIFPHFDPNQKGAVLGLKVDFAGNPHYYQKGKGLIPLALLPAVKKKLAKELSLTLPFYDGPQEIEANPPLSPPVEETLFACKANQKLTFELFPEFLLIHPCAK